MGFAYMEIGDVCKFTINEVCFRMKVRSINFLLCHNQGYLLVCCRFAVIFQIWIFLLSLLQKERLMRIPLLLFGFQELLILSPLSCSFLNIIELKILIWRECLKYIVYTAKYLESSRLVASLFQLTDLIGWGRDFLADLKLSFMVEYSLV